MPTFKEQISKEERELSVAPAFPKFRLTQIEALDVC